MKKIAQPILELSNISRSDKKSEVEKLNLSIPAGDCFVVLHSCPDNISLITEILSGRVAPKKGKIFFKGEDVTGRRNIFGIIKKDPQLPKFKTTAENASAPLLKRGLPRSVSNVLVKKELALVGLEDIADSQISKLPLQQALRALVFSAYMCSHELIAIDEPFSQLPEKERQAELAWLNDFRNKNKSSLLIFTEDIETALMLGDYVMMLDSHASSAGIVAIIGEKDKARKRITDVLERT